MLASSVLAAVATDANEESLTLALTRALVIVSCQGGHPLNQSKVGVHIGPFRQAPPSTRDHLPSNLSRQAPPPLRQSILRETKFNPVTTVAAAKANAVCGNIPSSRRDQLREG